MNPLETYFYIKKMISLLHKDKQTCKELGVKLGISTVTAYRAVQIMVYHEYAKICEYQTPLSGMRGGKTAVYTLTNKGVKELVEV